MQLKNYILRWSDNYQLVFQKSRLLSQIPIFIIAVITLCEIVSPFMHILPEEQVYWGGIIKYTIFYSVTFITLLIRFLLLFAKSKKSFWFSQVFWLISFVWFIHYFNALSHSGCLRTDEALMFLYLIGSSFRQFASLIISFLPKGKF